MGNKEEIPKELFTKQEQYDILISKKFEEERKKPYPPYPPEDIRAYVRDAKKYRRRIYIKNWLKKYEYKIERIFAWELGIASILFLANRFYHIVDDIYLTVPLFGGTLAVVGYTICRWKINGTEAEI